jgi:hypothetical protein
MLHQPQKRRIGAVRLPPTRGQCKDRPRRRHVRMSDGDHDAEDVRPALGSFQLPLLAAGQAAESSDDEEEAAPTAPAALPQSAAASSRAADDASGDEPSEPSSSLLPSAEDALDDDSAGAFLRPAHSVDVPAMEGFAEKASETEATQSAAEKQRQYVENAAACLAPRNQAPSANRKRKPEGEVVDSGHFRSDDTNARKNAGKVKGEFKKRSETSRGGERPRDRWD